MEFGLTDVYRWSKIFFFETFTNEATAIKLLLSWFLLSTLAESGTVEWRIHSDLEGFPKEIQLMCSTGLWNLTSLQVTKGVCKYTY